MKTIKLDCFNQVDFCQIISIEQSFLINNPLEGKFLLEIFNHGDNECTIVMKPSNFSKNDDLEKINMIITSDERIFFQDNLMSFFTKEVLLGSITNHSSVNYFFSVDLMRFILEEKKLTINFDLLFDFNCKRTNEFTNQDENSNYQTKKTNVLAASSSAEEEIALSSSFSRFSILLLLSSLFVIIFFVIMKFIHGQKKKKQKRVVV